MVPSDPNPDDALRRLIELTTQIRDSSRKILEERALFHRAELARHLGDISEERIATARVTMEEIEGRGELEKPLAASTDELRQILHKRELYEHLHVCFEQNRILGGDTFGMPLDVRVEQLALDPAFLMVHLVHGPSFPRFADWINRTLLLYADRLSRPQEALEDTESHRGRGHAATAMRQTALRQAAEGLFLALQRNEIDPRHLEKIDELFLAQGLDRPGLLDPFAEVLTTEYELLRRLILGDEAEGQTETLPSDLQN